VELGLKTSAPFLSSDFDIRLMFGLLRKPKYSPSLKYQYTPFERWGLFSGVGFSTSEAVAYAPNENVFASKDSVPTNKKGPAHDVTFVEVVLDGYFAL
jgi:hypothetical protein